MTTSDSFRYLVTSINFYNSGHLISLNGEIYTTHPPLFPFILSIFNILKFNMLIGVAFFHAMLYLTNGFLIIKLLEEHIEELPVRLYSSTISLLSIPFIINHVFIWSEALFYTLIILWAFIILKIEKDNSFKNWALIIAISVLICLQRKTGAIFVIVGVTYMLFKLELNIKNTLKIISYLSLSSVFPIYWRIRYREIVNESYYIPNFSLKQTWGAINQEVTELGSWIVPRVFPDFIKWLIVIAVLILIIYKLKTLLKSNVFLLSSLLIFIYSLSIITVMTFYKLNQTVDIRVMGAILPFIIIILGKSYSEYLKTKPSKLTLNIISISLTFVFLYNFSRTSQNLKNWAAISKISYPELVKLSKK